MKPKKFYVFLPEKSSLGKGMQGHAPGWSGPTEGFTVRARDFFFAQTEFLWEKRHKAPFFISHRNTLDCSIQMLNIVWM